MALRQRPVHDLPRRFILASLILFTFINCSCTPADPAEAFHTVRVQFTPATQQWTEAIQTCVWTLPGLSPLVEERTADSLDLASTDFALRLGEPDKLPAFSASLGWEEIVPIANPSLSIQTLSPDQIQMIFSGRIQRWNLVGGPEQDIQVWDYPKGDEVRQAFHSVYLPKLQTGSMARLAPDLGHMIEAVSNDTNTIGYLPKSRVNNQVQIVSLTPDAKSIQVPVLALATTEPVGATRQLIACLQKFGK